MNQLSNKARMRHLLLATVEDPYDVRSWSGIPFALREALERQVDKLTVFCPSPPARNPLDAALRLILSGKPPRWPLWMTETTLRRNAEELTNAVQQSGAQAVLSISSQCIAQLMQYPVPTYMFSDAPWLAWKETYADYEPMPMRGHSFAKMEAAAARRCSGLFFGSTWAVQEAERLYFGGAVTIEQRSRLHETQLGANWRPEVSRSDLYRAIHERPQDRLDVLFVGKDWERKGGPLAVEIIQRLRTSISNACLHVVGCVPNLPYSLLEGDHPAVRIHGPLYQNAPDERARLHELFLRSHLLLVPTKAECFGIIFAEAQGFGLPPVSRNVQALPSVVIDGQTGLLLAPEAGPEVYANRVLSLVTHWPTYLTMAEAGVERANNITNWDHMAKSMSHIIFEQPIGNPN